LWTRTQLLGRGGRKPCQRIEQSFPPSGHAGHALQFWCIAFRMPRSRRGETNMSRACAVVLIHFLLVACGGPRAPGPTIAAAHGPGDYLVVGYSRAANSPDVTIYAVDPAAPLPPAFVETLPSLGTTYAVAPAWVMDTLSHAKRRVGDAHLVYVKDGKIFTVD